MISTMSDRATISSMNACGMRPATDRLPSTAELGFDFCPDGGHIGAALRLALDQAHDLAHVLDAGRAGGPDGIADQGVDLGIAQLGGQVALQQGDLRCFLVDQVLPMAGLELNQRLLALFDHFLENAQHLGVVEGNSLVDFALLDGSRDHADQPQPLLLAGAHRRLHVIGNSFFERHPYAASTLSRRAEPEPPTGGWRAGRPRHAYSLARGALNAVLPQ